MSNQLEEVMNIIPGDIIVNRSGNIGVVMYELDAGKYIAYEESFSLLANYEPDFTSKYAKELDIMEVHRGRILMWGCDLRSALNILKINAKCVWARVIEEKPEIRKHQPVLVRNNEEDDWQLAYFRCNLRNPVYPYSAYTKKMISQEGDRLVVKHIDPLEFKFCIPHNEGVVASERE